MLSKKRYLKFLLVGALGIVVNYAFYAPFREILTFDIWMLHFDAAWFAGIGISATTNYVLNELWTFDHKEK